MFAHLLKGVLVWLSYTLFPLTASLPFFGLLWILGKDKTQRPQWEWLEDIDSEDLTRVIGLIIIVWLVSGAVIIIGSILRAVIEGAGKTVSRDAEDAAQEIHDRRQALLAEEEEPNPS